MKNCDNKKKVVFVSECKYPNGDASAKRNICLARYFVDRDYETVFVGLGNTKYKTKIQYGDYSIVSLKRYQSGNIFKRVLNHCFIKKQIAKFVANHYDNADILIVDPRLFKEFKKNSYYRKKHFLNSKVAFSVVEYHSQSEYIFKGFFSSGYRENILFNEKSNSNDGSIIAISRYLYNHFESKGFNTIRIPFVIDKTCDLSATLEKKQPMNYDDSKRTFIYCGNPRKKDLLEEMILGFLSLDPEMLKKCKLLVFGVDYDWLNKNHFSKKQISIIKCFSVFYGKTPYSKLVDFYSRVDFSILLRPFNERYSKAGFPTKITESLEFGVPPIVNFTSDLELYLKDDVNCIQVFGDNYISFSEAIQRALKVKNDELVKLKNNAIQTSKKALNIKSFYSDLDDFINKM